MADVVKPCLVVVKNVLVEHSLNVMRRKHTTNADFRRALAVIAPYLYAEALADVHMKRVACDTPVEERVPLHFINDRVLLVPILRAGLGLLGPIHELLPEASVGHVGLARDHQTLMPNCYYNNLPPDTKERFVVVLDPMVATGGSSCATLDIVMDSGVDPFRVVMMSLVCAPEGIAQVHKQHPDVKIVTAAVDSHLNDKGYIVPGLGDAGDRLFGTI